MKTKFANACIIIFVTMFAISCKENTEKDKVVAQEENKNFIVEIDYKTSQKNMFIMYFYEEKGQFFDAENTVWLGVQPSEVVQKAVLEIPDERLPIDLRINFCFEKLKGPIQFEAITLKYQDLSFEITKAQITEYFEPNEYLKFDAATGLATPIELDGKTDPFFVSKDKLWNLIKNLNEGTLNQPATILAPTN